MSKMSSRVDPVVVSSRRVSHSNRKNRGKISHSAVTDTACTSDSTCKGEPVKQEGNQQPLDKSTHYGDSANTSKENCCHWIALLLFFSIASAALTLAILTEFGLINLKDAAPTPVPTSSGAESNTPPGPQQLEETSSKISNLEDKGEDFEKRLNDVISNLREYKTSVQCTFDRRLKYSTEREIVTAFVEEGAEFTISGASCSTEYYLSSYLHYATTNPATNAREFWCECTGLLGLPAGERGICGIDFWMCDRP